jgi:hypothetical protein
MDSPRELDELGKVKAIDGSMADSSAIEKLVQEHVNAVEHCMLVTHASSNELGCILTLRSAPNSSVCMCISYICVWVCVCVYTHAAISA